MRPPTGAPCGWETEAYSQVTVPYMYFVLLSMYKCMYVCVDLRMYACVYVSMPVYRQIHTHKCVCVCGVCVVCVRVWCVCVCVCDSLL